MSPTPGSTSQAADPLASSAAPAAVGFAEHIAPASKDAALAIDGYFVWDGSMIHDDRPDANARYQLYATRWPADLGFKGWLTDSKVIRAEADSLDGPFTFREQLDSLNQQPWCRDMAHNPRVHRFGDRYYLYYIGTYWGQADPARARACRDDADFEHWTTIRFRQRIGVATAPTAAGPWTPCEHNPVFKPRPEAWDHGMVTNPAPFELPDGRIGMVYKSTAGPREPLMLGMTIAPTPQGPYERVGPSPLIDADIEDPCVWATPQGYRMLVKDMTGDVCGIERAGVLYRSDDALHWQRAEDRPAYGLDLAWRDGTTVQARYVERPCVYVEHGQPMALTNATLVEPGPAAVLVRRLNHPDT